MNVGIDTDFLVRLNIKEHNDHASTIEMRDRILDAGDRFALAPQVLAEFVHVVTDPRRFERPLSMDDALLRASDFWNAAEVIQTLPSAGAVAGFFDLMRVHNLGRKRILDTLLAATYIASGVKHLLTGNPSDYRIFKDLVLLEL